MRLNSLHMIACLGALFGLLSTPLSSWADWKNLSASSDVAEVLQLVEEVSHQNLSLQERRTQVGQVLESTSLPTLYSSRFGPFGGELVQTTTLSVSSWRIIADYLEHTGFSARLIDSLKKKHSRAKYSFETLSKCVVKEQSCDLVDFKEDLLLNRSYLGINDNQVPTEIAFQEVRGLINSQIILANTNICQLMKAGLTKDEVISFFENLYMTDSMGTFFLANQRLSSFALYMNVRSCTATIGEWELPAKEALLNPWKCQNQGNRKICDKKRAQP